MRWRFIRVFTSLAALSFSSAARGQAALAYDLAEDQRQRVEQALRELGRGTHTKLVNGVFVVIGASDGMWLMERAVAAYFNGRFERRPERAVSVYLLPSTERYDAYCKQQLGEACASVYGFYRPDLRRIVMNASLGIGTLTHELVHPIMETDFPRAPTWLDEGIASLYEASVMPRPGEIHGRKNWRYAGLMSALASHERRSQVTVEHLFALSDAEFRGPEESLNYALARYFCQWLDEQHELWPFYRAWKQGYASDEAGELAFTRVTGLAPAAATPKLLRWLRALKA
jgi:hypothetical protein